MKNIVDGIYKGVIIEIYIDYIVILEKFQLDN
jgi:hypothetical protein